LNIGAVRHWLKDYNHTANEIYANERTTTGPIKDFIAHPHIGEPLAHELTVSRFRILGTPTPGTKVLHSGKPLNHFYRRKFRAWGVITPHK
jgi:hypothetical protein